MLTTYTSNMIDSSLIELKSICKQFKALGDVTRLQILALLGEEKRCVCDLQTSLKIPGNLLSHHLKVLRDANLVIATKRGRWVDYTTNSESLDKVRDFLPPDLEKVGIEQLLVCGSEVPSL